MPRKSQEGGEEIFSSFENFIEDLKLFCLSSFARQSIRSGFCRILLCPEKRRTESRGQFPILRNETILCSIPRNATNVNFIFFSAEGETFSKVSTLFVESQILPKVKLKRAFCGFFRYFFLFLSALEVCNLLDFCKAAIKILLRAALPQIFRTGNPDVGSRRRREKTTTGRRPLLLTAIVLSGFVHRVHVHHVHQVHVYHVHENNNMEVAAASAHNRRCPFTICFGGYNEDIGLGRTLPLARKQ